MDIFSIRDKIVNFGITTDKENSYLHNYDEFFSRFREDEIHFLEIGIFNGGSLLLWAEYFKKGLIYGIDAEHELPEKYFQFLSENNIDRVHPFLDFITPDLAVPFDKRKKKFDDLLGNLKFDVILDDGAHTYTHTKGSYEVLFDSFLKPGGLYIIEDWGTTYFTDWPDGSVEGDKGIGKMIKELSDEVAIVDRYKGRKMSIEGLQSKIDSVTIRFGQIWVTKSKV